LYVFVKEELKKFYVFTSKIYKMSIFVNGYFNL
jgi:hypothetical protein